MQPQISHSQVAVDVLTDAATGSLEAARPVTWQIRGRCMEPGLPDGTEVRTTPARFYFPGDVAVFRSASGAVKVHRVLLPLGMSGRGWLLTRGDRSAERDALVPQRRAVGKVRWLARGSVGPVPFQVSIQERCRAFLRALPPLPKNGVPT